jgi:hypothetical protein
MGAHSTDDLFRHIGHDIECVTYGGKENIAVECTDCNEILLDFDQATPPAASRTCESCGKEVGSRHHCRPMMIDIVADELIIAIQRGYDVDGLVRMAMAHAKTEAR